MSSTAVPSVISQSSLTTTTKALITLACAVPVISGGYFAFARVKGDICLVQGAFPIRCVFLSLFINDLFRGLVSSATPMSALTTVDVKIFRHEFVTIFRFSEARTLHPTDISIIEHINDNHIRYEEDNEMVFVARELIDRIRKTAEKPSAPRTRIGRYGMYSQFTTRRR